MQESSRFDRHYAYACTRKALQKMFDGELEGDVKAVSPGMVMWAMHELRLGFPQEGDLGNKHLNWIRDQLYELMDTSRLLDHPDAAERGALTLRAEQLTAKERSHFARDLLALRGILEEEGLRAE